MTDAPLLVGLDVGTHSVRALAFTPSGGIAGVQAVDTPSEPRGPGSADYHPEDLWQAVRTVLGRLAAELARPEAVAAIATASVAESCILIDDAGQPVHDAIVWHDRRTHAQAERLAERLGTERLQSVTGLPFDPIQSIYKLLWLQEHAPAAYARGTRVLNVADWIAYRLCGEIATDYSLASRMGALDLHNHRWADDLLGAIGVDPALFPPLRASGTPLGPLRADVAADLGLDRRCTVAVGGHDHLCGGMAAGAHRPGILLDSVGTAEALMLTVASPFPGTAVPAAGFAQGTMAIEAPYAYLGSGINHAGGAIEWVRHTVANDVDHATFEAEAAAVPPGAEGVCFVPHLAGSPPPHADARARGAFVGLTTGLSRATLARAVLEGVAMEARVVTEGIEALPGCQAPTDIRVTGGGTRSDLLLTIKASVFGRALTVVEQAETTALGAALLAGLAAGVYPDLESALAGLDHTPRTVQPDAAWQAIYDELFARVFRQTFGALRPLNHAIHATGIVGRDA